MSEEEIEAIKHLEILSNEKCECEACQRAKKEYKIILNLLDEQQKETQDLVRIINKQLKELEDKQKEQNLIFQLKDEEKELIEVTQNIISKDKIMAKIEELEKQAKEMKYDYDVSYAEEDLFNKNVKFFKEQMHELLEEPKLLEEK